MQYSVFFNLIWKRSFLKVSEQVRFLCSSIFAFITNGKIQLSQALAFDDRLDILKHPACPPATNAEKCGSPLPYSPTPCGWLSPKDALERTEQLNRNQNVYLWHEQINLDQQATWQKIYSWSVVKRNDSKVSI